MGGGLQRTGRAVRAACRGGGSGRWRSRGHAQLPDRPRLPSRGALSSPELAWQGAGLSTRPGKLPQSGPLLDPPLERVEMPFTGRPGEGTASIGYLRKPKGVERAPVAVIWGGIDSFKEERPADAYLAGGMAVLAIDMPGVGEAPLVGSEDAERLWDAVFGWIAARPDLDVERIGLVGGSTGGYWATKLAHTHRDRVTAAVNHGGPAHIAFTADWIAKAQFGEYPFELAETLACAFGLSTYQDWVEYSPRLSLLRLGILDQPCAPLLCVNGLDDSVFPIADMYLLLEHGSPKAARFFATGHMGKARKSTRLNSSHVT